MKKEIVDIKAKEVEAKLAESNWSTLDVRDQKERLSGSLAGLHIPLPQLGNNMDQIPAHQNLIVYCRCGNRSITAIELLLKAGFEGELLNLEGGMMSVHRARAKSF